MNLRLTRRQEEFLIGMRICAIEETYDRLHLQYYWKHEIFHYIFDAIPTY